MEEKQFLDRNLRALKLAVDKSELSQKITFDSEKRIEAMEHEDGE